MKKYYVVWRYDGKEEQRKGFADFARAMRFQAGLLKNKEGLVYALYDF